MSGIVGLIVFVFVGEALSILARSKGASLLQSILFDDIVVETVMYARFEANLKERGGLKRLFWKQKVGA